MVREMFADVPEPGGAEQRIAQRVQHHIAVGVRRDPPRMRHAHAAQHDEFARTEGVHVETGADPHGELRRAASKASASARSLRFVTLRFAAEPSMSAGRSPSHSKACASSLGLRASALAASSAAHSGP